jgi:RNA polymerase sigma-70 factor (ECF subfamily)
MTLTSQSLLESLRDRANEQAWQRLLTIYEPWLRGWLGRHDLQPADVEDVLQDILIVVSQKVPAFVHNGQPGAFRTWLRTILTNCVRQFLRGRQAREAVVGAALSPDWLDQLEDDNSALVQQWNEEHDQHLIRRTLAIIQSEFNPRTWELFHLLVLENRPAAEVAQQFRMKTNAVYVAKSRVLARLRQELRGLMEI